MSSPAVAPYGAYRTADGQTVVLGTTNDAEWQRLSRQILERDDLADDPRFANNAGRCAHRDILDDAIGAWCAAHDLEHVQKTADAAGIGNARYNLPSEVLVHPQLTARDRWRQVDTPAGPIPALLPPPVISGYQPAMGAVPGLGQHTDSVLAELGIARRRNRRAASPRRHRTGLPLMSEESVLLCSDRNGVRTLTLNRPRRKNAINRELWIALAEALTAAGNDRGVRAVVITGAGGAFCSGADISTPDDSHPVYKLQRLTDVALALHELPVPTIAKVTGVAVGAGWNLALGCDLVAATPESTFSQIFSKRGLSVDLGGSWLLPKIVGLQQAKRLALLAETIDAAEAHALNLVTWVVSATEIDDFVTDIADRLAAGPPIALAQTKALLNEGADRTLRDALANEARAQVVNFATADARGGVCRLRRAARAVVYWSVGGIEIGADKCVKQSSSRRCGRRSASATAGCRHARRRPVGARAQRTAGARRHRPGDHRRRRLGMRVAGRRPVEQYRALRGAGRRLAREHPGHDDQPRLRFQPAGARLRGAGGDVRPAGRRRGRRCRGDEPGAAGFGQGNRDALRPQSACPL